MLTADAISHFGGVGKLSEALGVSRAAIYQWGEFVPKGRQFEIEILSEGALKANRDKAKQAA